MKPSEHKISIGVISYDEKAVEKYRNFYVAETRNSFQPIKDIDPKF